MCCFEDHPTPWLTIKNQDCFIPIPSQVLYIQPGLPKRSVWEAQSHARAATRTHCASAALIAFAATVFVATRSWAINCQGVLVAGAKLRSIGTTRKYCRKKKDFIRFLRFYMPPKGHSSSRIDEVYNGDRRSELKYQFHFLFILVSCWRRAFHIKKLFLSYFDKTPDTSVSTSQRANPFCSGNGCKMLQHDLTMHAGCRKIWI